MDACIVFKFLPALSYISDQFYGIGIENAVMEERITRDVLVSALPEKMIFPIDHLRYFFRNMGWLNKLLPFCVKLPIFTNNVSISMLRWASKLYSKTGLISRFVYWTTH